MPLSETEKTTKTSVTSISLVIRFLSTGITVCTHTLEHDPVPFLCISIILINKTTVPFWSIIIIDVIVDCYYLCWHYFHFPLPVKGRILSVVLGISVQTCISLVGPGIEIFCAGLLCFLQMKGWLSTLSFGRRYLLWGIAKTIYNVLGFYSNYIIAWAASVLHKQTFVKLPGNKQYLNASF